MISNILIILVYLISEIIGGYMIARTLVVFYVLFPDIFVLFFLSKPISGIVYSIMPNKTLPYHTIRVITVVFKETDLKGAIYTVCQKIFRGGSGSIMCNKN